MKSKKSLTLLLLLCVICIAATAIFTACGEVHDHDYTEVVTQPTCTARGYTTYTCACGDSYVDNYINALGHDKQQHAQKSPTCTDIGWYAYETCSRCDYTTYNEVAKWGHNFVNGVCTRCSSKESDTSDNNTNNPPEGHTHSYAEVITQPTCTERGYTTYTCECGESYIDNYTDELGHDKQQHTAQVATCTEIGWNAYETCSRCDYTTYEEIEIDSNNHDLQQHEAQAPTCVAVGWHTYETCSRCDYTTYEEIEALGHNYVDDFCTRCGKQESSVGLLYIPTADGTGYSVADIGTCMDKNIVIASKYNGLPVKEIGENAFKNSNIKSINIPDSVTSISSYAFRYCTSLTSVTIGNSVTSIGSFAFDGCTSLTSITIPDSVTSIGNNAFSSCRSLTSITIPDSVTSIGQVAFNACRSLTSITIPDSVTSIGSSAFAYCTSLTSVTIGNSVASINYEAFKGCTSLTNINIPDSATSISAEAFDGCTSLTSITIPDSVTSIGNNAFKGCTSLKSVIFKNPKGWECNGTSFIEAVLSNPATAAIYLTKTYTSKWSRK